MSNFFISGVSGVAPSFSAIGTLTASQNMTASQNAAGTVISFAAPLQGEKIIAYSTGATFGATGDTLLTMNANLTNGYIVRRVTLANPTATAILVAASGSLRTASAGGGVAVVTPLLVTGLTATNSFLDQTLALASTTLTAAQLFFNVTVATGTSGVYQLFVWGESFGG